MHTLSYRALSVSVDTYLLWIRSGVLLQKIKISIPEVVAALSELPKLKQEGQKWRKCLKWSSLRCIFCASFAGTVSIFRKHETFNTIYE